MTADSFTRTGATTGRLARLAGWAKDNKLSATMTLFLLVVVLCAVLAPLVAPHDPLALDLKNPLAGPSSTHWLGTDDLGRDLFSRLIYGARISMAAAFIAVGVAVLVALPYGLAAGYMGGRVDAVLMRLLDIQIALPGLVIIVAIASALGGGIVNTMIAMAFALVPPLARVVRGETLAVRQETYVEASRAIGSSAARIMRSRILRNIAPPLAVQAAITCGLAMGTEAALSFLGLGARAPQASWGSILRRSYDSIFVAPTQVLYPAILICLTAWAFNSLGDALSDSIGGRSRNHRRGFQPLTRSESTREVATDHATPLAVEGVSVAVDGAHGRLRLVDDLAFTVPAGKVLGIVGESGSGKTVTAMTLTRLFPSPPGVVTDGVVSVAGRDVLRMSPAELRALRGSEVSMIFQNPRASLNPALTIGHQIAEVLRWHGGHDRRSAASEAEALLQRVGVPATRMKSYPHQLSGGMCQRAMIAVALACQPRLLIADEPTSALDVTVQAGILDLMHELTASGMSIVFITHDLGVVADICDEVLVMYAGQAVERGPVHDVLLDPAHPYTWALIGALPGAQAPMTRLATIGGRVPPAGTAHSGCRFADRCKFVEDVCRTAPIELDAWRGSARVARCRRSAELLGGSEGSEFAEVSNGGRKH